MDIADRLALARSKDNLTQAEFGELCNPPLAQGTISNIELGKRRPTQDQRKAIETALERLERGGLDASPKSPVREPATDGSRNQSGSTPWVTDDSGYSFVVGMLQKLDSLVKRKLVSLEVAVKRQDEITRYWLEESLKNTRDDSLGQNNSAPKGQVFISYSHKDREWRERLQEMLAPIEGEALTLWDDTMIQPGADWKEEIYQALSRAKVAVLLVTASFLASAFIREHELLPLLKAAEERGLRIIWVAVSPSLVKRTPISNYQSANGSSKPLSLLSKEKQDEELARIGELIATILEETDGEFVSQAGTGDS